VIAASLLGGRQNSSGVCPPRLLVSSHPYPYPSPVLYFILYAFLLEDPQATVFQYFSLRISYDTQGRYVGALVCAFLAKLVKQAYCSVRQNRASPHPSQFCYCCYRVATLGPWFIYSFLASLVKVWMQTYSSSVLIKQKTGVFYTPPSVFLLLLGKMSSSAAGQDGFARYPSFVLRRGQVQDRLVG